MKYLLLFLLVTACTSAPATFAAPAKGDPTWDLNVGLWPGSTGH